MRRRRTGKYALAAPARPLADALAALVDILVANAVEAEMMGGGPVDDLASARRAATALGRRLPVAIVTAGPHGAAVAGGEGDFALPAPPVKVASTHGAGDCFVGVLAARLAAGAGLGEAVEAAVAAAGRLVATAEAERGRRTPQR